MTLLTEKFNYKPINRNEETGKRLYLCPDGSKVPSVTTILSATQPKEKIESLNRWKNSVGTQKAQQITTEASGRGTRMHKFLEDFVLNGSLNQPGTNPYSKQGHLMAETIVNQGLVHVNEIWGSEVGLYYPGLYAGTTDAVGVHKNEDAILDYKQSNKPKKIEWISDYFLQLMAYALAHNKVYGTNIRKGVVLMCVAPPEISPLQWGEPQYQEFILTPEDFNYWENKWWDRVEQFYNQN